MKKIIFIHGRATKPLKDELKNLWFDAVASGLKRGHGSTGVEKFNSVDKEFVYFGDISNEFLNEHNNETIPDDIESRRYLYR